MSVYWYVRAPALIILFLQALTSGGRFGGKEVKREGAR